MLIFFLNMINLVCLKKTCYFCPLSLLMFEEQEEKIDGLT